MNLNQNVDREEQFGERERQCLKNGAEAFVPVWTMQKRAFLLMKKNIRTRTKRWRLFILTGGCHSQHLAR